MRYQEDGLTLYEGDALAPSRTCAESGMALREALEKAIKFLQSEGYSEDGAIAIFRAALATVRQEEQIG